ncbi:unnamed protein product [Periconia digitata]|uniref:Heterokaryon incompatibility domain-containing protein n=1 Tax=Periconia digitata TaxID=1303443 RepID=A0A9W4U6I3_9PLEO|nr:unnamed protein product [Periconia digitata]
MIDDTQDIGNGEVSPRVSLFSEIDNIMKYQVVRAHAERWSQNLHFLTYDDSHDDNGEPGQSQLPHESNSATQCVTGQCKRCERRTPVPSGHQCQSHFSFSGGHYEEEDVREKALEEYSNPCVHVKALTCDECQHVPLFPNEGPVTCFKIRQIPRSSLIRCRHFVAVSYCWSDADSSTQDAYNVIDENGKHRRIRATGSVIDRVVNFARENGYRMIWIDQECIDQDDPEVKALAVQAIDLVYLEAHASIGLLRAQLQQKHLNALAITFENICDTSFKKRRGITGFKGPCVLDPNTLLEAISFIANDKWNTRAWVLQEAFVSSGNMMLLFPQKTDSRSAGWTMICHEMSLSELVIRLDVIVDCIKCSLRYVVPKLWKHIADAEKPKRTQSTQKGGAQSSSDLRTTLKRITLFHPERPARASIAQFTVNGNRRQMTCSAAAALTYLRLRDCYDKADKLAITANMCGYPLRLNTVELGQRQKSLGTCLIALSLCNGDTSLITPEVYRSVPTRSITDLTRQNSDHEFTWNRDFNSRLADVYSQSFNTFGSTAAPGTGNRVDIGQSGLGLMGNSWKINRFIECHKLQQKYRESWTDLNKNLNTATAETMWLATTHLLFEIINALKSRGEIQVADSILNSTSSAQIESVNEFSPGLCVENRKGMFSLHSDGNGRYHQCWIIDRVMEKGGFWVGKLVEDAIPRPLARSEQDDSKYMPARNEGGHMAELVSYQMLSDLLTLERIKDQRRELENQVSTDSFRTFQSDIMVSLALSLSNLARHPDFFRDMEDRQGIFDVDGDTSGNCLVFTPFNMNLEVIPRPELRSMSVSWQVQPVSDTLEDKIESKPAKKMRTLQSVKGMWRYTSKCYHRVYLV